MSPFFFPIVPASSREDELLPGCSVSACPLSRLLLDSGPTAVGLGPPEEALGGSPCYLDGAGPPSLCHCCVLRACCLQVGGVAEGSKSTLGQECELSPVLQLGELAC